MIRLLTGSTGPFPGALQDSREHEILLSRNDRSDLAAFLLLTTIWSVRPPELR
jgi:hypothetical protein